MLQNVLHHKLCYSVQNCIILLFHSIFTQPCIFRQSKKKKNVLPFYIPL